jgi:hypothetical protein
VTANVQPRFSPGSVRISSRSPIGRHRLPTYPRGRIGTTEAVAQIGQFSTNPSARVGPQVKS